MNFRKPPPPLPRARPKPRGTLKLAETPGPVRWVREGKRIAKGEVMRAALDALRQMEPDDVPPLHDDRVQLDWTREAHNHDRERRRISLVIARRRRTLDKF